MRQKENTRVEQESEKKLDIQCTRYEKKENNIE